MATNWEAYKPKTAEKKKSEDGGILGNLRGLGEMFNPATLAPNLIAGIGGGLAGTVKETARLLPTTIANVAGQMSPEEMDKSPLSFMFNTDLVRNVQGDKSVVDKARAGVGQVAPILNTVAEPIAETGLRGASLLASAVSQTGRLGGPFTPMTPEEMLAQSGNADMSFEARAREGKGLSTLAGDILTVAPAARGAAAVGSKAGLLSEATAGKIARGANLAETAPLAPISIPGKALYGGIKRAAAGEVAFPRLNAMAASSPRAIAALPAIDDLVAQQAAALPEAATAQAATESLSAARIAEAEAANAPSVAAGLPMPKVSHLGAPEMVARRAEVARLGEVASTLPERTQLATAAREAATTAQAALDEQTAALRATVEAEREGIKPTLRGKVAGRVEDVIQNVGDVWAKTEARNELFRKSSERTAALQRQPDFENLDLPGQQAAITAIKAKATEEVKAEFLRQRGKLAPGEGMVGIDAKGNLIDVDMDGNVVSAKSAGVVNQEAGRQAQEMTSGTKPKVSDAEKVGQGSLFDDAQVGTKEPVMYVPKKTVKLVNDAMEGIKDKKKGGALVQAVDDITAAWKTGVLPLNPAWQVNNIVSNSLTAMTHGGITPKWFWENKGRIKAALDDPPEGLAHATGAGTGADIIARSDVPAATKAGRVIDKVSEKTYKLNSDFDEMAHMAVAMKKLDDLKAQGITGDVANRTATDFARKTMGDFENMSPFEKNVMKRAIPFYAWSKHSAKFNLRELVENPVRQARLGAVSQAVAPQGRAEGNEFLSSAIPLGGGRFLQSGALNMGQGLTGGLTKNPLTSPKATLGAFNPLVQAGAALGGLDARSGEALNVAPDQSFLSGARGYLTNQSAPTKAIADLVDKYKRGGLLEGTNVATGDVRNPITAGGRPISTRTEDVGPIPAPLLKFLTGVSVQEPDLKGQAKRAKKKEKTETKKAKKYQKDKDKAAK